MTRDDIIRMAQKANLVMYDYDHPSLERFAAFVAVQTLANNPPSSFMSYQEGFEAGQFAERESCARLVEDWDSDGPDPRKVAEAIRARGIV